MAFLQKLSFNLILFGCSYFKKFTNNHIGLLRFLFFHIHVHQTRLLELFKYIHSILLNTAALFFQKFTFHHTRLSIFSIIRIYIEETWLLNFLNNCIELFVFNLYWIFTINLIRIVHHNLNWSRLRIFFKTRISFHQTRLLLFSIKNYIRSDLVSKIFNYPH